MAVVKKGLGINVLEASKIRLKNIFNSGCKVYCNVSGGKDSIVLMSLVYDLLLTDEINPKQLEVVFIDEEVIYDDVVRVCEEWRKKFMMVGVKYTWYTIEHRNNNCFNALENNENFIPWDRYEEEKWARKKPKFAVSESPYLVPRTENYQDFTKRAQRDGITIIGVRASESYQRAQYLSVINSVNGGISNDGKMYPIYDWTDADVWKYIKDNNIDFPDVYLRMYESGIPRKNLRVCNLFSIDTCQALTQMFEVYPDLWEAVLRREPNAYLVRLYWDTEMFRRQTKTRQRLKSEKEKQEEANTNYKQKVFDIINNPTKYFRNKHALDVAKTYRNLVVSNTHAINDEHYKKIYEALLAGDTKLRTFRSIRTKIYLDYKKENGILEKDYTNHKGRIK